MSKLPWKTQMSIIQARDYKLIYSLLVSGYLQTNMYVTKEQETKFHHWLLSIQKDKDYGKNRKFEKAKDNKKRINLWS